jgi:hypothetical protein
MTVEDDRKESTALTAFEAGRLSEIPQLAPGAADSLTGGEGTVVFFGDLPGFVNHATGDIYRLLPYHRIGRGFFDDIAGELAQQH